ncbi:MAG: hypothetical protein IPK17_00390 [Chloroflexi bacterium]|uniref:hypothetical protein n=1 Tax=Candidatus Flexifilum breve TaxID=3140694 RepID=UPI003134BCA6|nr:hypothetical protein [Chloroflexota bacterium]
MKTILVQFAETRWTSEAVTQACILARNSQACVVVLRLIPVPHPSYLGTDIGYLPPNPREYRRLDEYRATAEDYGVNLTIEAMHSISSFDALLQAVEHFGAEIVFAHFPEAGSLTGSVSKCGALVSSSAANSSRWINRCLCRKRAADD